MLAQETFTGPNVGWFALSPLITLVAGALFLLVAGALTPRWPRGTYALVSAATAGTAGALAIVLWDDIADDGPETLVAGALALDTFAMFVTIIICVSVLLVSLITDDFLRREGYEGPEVYAMYLITAVGGVVPEEAALRWAYSTLDRLLTRIRERTAWVRTHYRGDNEPILRPGATPVPLFP